MMIDAAADGLMPRTHRQALDLLLPPGTDLILVPPLATAHVRRLWCAASPMRIHASSDVDARRRLGDLSVSPEQLAPVLKEMVTRIVPSLAPRPGLKRVFLARRPYRDRKLVNRVLIEAIAEARGFRLLYPEDMPFVDQVHALRHAQFILVPDGAALFLALFGESGARVCVLGHSHSPSEPLLAALLAEIGVECRVLPGRCVRDRETKLETFDYEIDEFGFARFLDRWLNGEEL
jgi:capsular polysaccharide biosynthesis protein